MTQEEKKLLLIDLSARLPYGVIVHTDEINIAGKLIDINIPYNTVFIRTDVQSGEYAPVPISDVKPYLRPMSSMTEEEKKTLNNILEYQYCSDDSCMCEASDWLNENHFDYRGLIPMGLALEAKEGMYEED